MDWQASHATIDAPVGSKRDIMKLFSCDACGHTLYFDNFKCTSCGHRLGFDPAKLDLVAFDRPSTGSHSISSVIRTLGFAKTAA